VPANLAKTLDIELSLKRAPAFSRESPSRTRADKMLAATL
jgi:hypothetical protein